MCKTGVCGRRDAGIDGGAPDAGIDGDAADLGIDGGAADLGIDGRAPPRFTDLDDGTVRDNNGSGFEWQQGFSPGEQNQAASNTYCASPPLDGGGWRLPTMDELVSIVDRSRTDPSIDTSFFPGTPSREFWSSSPVAGSPSNGWSSSAGHALSRVGPALAEYYEISPNLRPELRWSDVSLLSGSFVQRVSRYDGRMLLLHRCLALCIGLFSGCAFAPLDLEGRPCPCASGWTCGPDAVCVRDGRADLGADLVIDGGTGDAGERDAAVRDAASTDAASTDAGLDAGTGLDAGAGAPDLGIDGGAPPRFTDLGDGTVRDNNGSGLEWEQGVSPGFQNQAASIAYCTTLALDSGGWRLPAIDELRSIVDRSRTFPAIDTSFFPGTPSNSFWSSSPVVGSPSSGRLVNFDNGDAYDGAATSSNRARCVR